MKKKIVTVIVLLVLFIASIIYLVYINTHKGQGEYNYSRIDIVFMERQISKQTNNVGKINTNVIVDNNYEKISNCNEVEVNLINKNDGNTLYIEAIPTISQLGKYNILLEKDTGYGVFTYIDQQNIDEVYKVYIKDERVVGTRDVKKDVLYTDASHLEGKTILNIEKAFKYYTDITKQH